MRCCSGRHLDSAHAYEGTAEWNMNKQMTNQNWTDWAQNTVTVLIHAPQPSHCSAQTILPACDRSWSGTWRSASQWKWSTVTPTSSSACPLTRTAACWPPAAKTRRCESLSHALGRSSRWEEGMLVCSTNRGNSCCYRGYRHKSSFTIYYCFPLSRCWTPWVLQSYLRGQILITLNSFSQTVIDCQICCC